MPDQEIDWALISRSADVRYFLTILAGQRDQALAAAMAVGRRALKDGSLQAEKEVLYLIQHAGFLQDIIDNPERAYREEFTLVQSHLKAGDEDLKREMQQNEHASIWEFGRWIRERRAAASRR